MSRRQDTTPFWAGFALAIVILLDLMGRRSLSTADRAAANGPAETAGSLYDFGVSVVGSDGARHTLGELRGHPVLASMFDASSPTGLATLIADLRRVEAALPPGVRNDTRVLLVSFDPERDQPAVLRDLSARHRLDGQRWLVAAPESEDGARLLAVGLGIRHSTRIVLLGRDGRVRATADDTARATARIEPALVGAGL